MIKFRTINVDGVEVARVFGSVEEMRKDWYSDNCTLPMLDDELTYAEVDGVQLHYPRIFKDLVEELGIEEEMEHE